MPGLIGKKVGMTSMFDANGINVPCTVIEAGPCVVTQIRTVEKDGYAAVQLAYDEISEKHASKALKGHFDKAGTTPKRKLVEFKSFDIEEVSHSPCAGELNGAVVCLTGYSLVHKFEG